jgi:hypothetical protein
MCARRAIPDAGVFSFSNLKVSHPRGVARMAEWAARCAGFFFGAANADSFCHFREGEVPA